VDLRSLYDLEVRCEGDEPGMRREVAPGVVRQVDLLGSQSAVTYSHLAQGDADAAIRREAMYFERLGHDVEWKLYGHDRPADLGGLLAEHGFAAEDEETVLVLELAEAPQELLAEVAPCVRRIEDPGRLGDVTRVREAVWPGELPWLEDRLSWLMRCAPERVSVFVAYAGDEPVSAARIEYPARPGGFAGIWGGATLPAWRGRGLYTALLAARAQEAVARGMRFLTIDASPMSRPIVERHGFRALTTARAHVRPCSAHLGASDV